MEDLSKNHLLELAHNTINEGSPLYRSTVEFDGIRREIPKETMPCNPIPNLQELAHQLSLPLTVDNTINEGAGDAPLFRCSVEFDGIRCISSKTFHRKKDGEKHIAKVALIAFRENKENPQCTMLFLLENPAVSPIGAPKISLIPEDYIPPPPPERELPPQGDGTKNNKASLSVPR